MKILVLDNYDSFTYNLVQYLREISEHEICIFRNDAIELDAVNAYDAIVLSPGPGIPSEAGIMPELIKQYASQKPIFGVCLGHQAIGEAFGADLQNLSEVYHGLSTPIEVTDSEEEIFKDIAPRFEVGRYHSWVVKNKNFPSSLKITAVDEEGAIMALSHKVYCVRGVQFHPESVMTPEGKKMLSNFLKLAENFHKEAIVGLSNISEHKS